VRLLSDINRNKHRFDIMIVHVSHFLLLNESSVWSLMILKQITDSVSLFRMYYGSEYINKRVADLLEKLLI